MAKISPVSLKYIIHAKFQASGAIEKPDIIGAIFGQTEGLLGEDLEMRELQKSGKIGRIEVNLDYGDGKTTGEIEVPSAMDKTETTIIAASLETIERVGPSDTKITVLDIEDVRGSKRDYILERAKKLMERIGDSNGDVDEMTEEIKTHTKISKIQSYGTENLPCGDISGPELIVVEGRADVVNLLKKGIKNVIAMNGAKLPPTVRDLSHEKDSVILFVDGDRGGNLIIKNFMDTAKVDFIAMAPEGKEVEELTDKEILQALRKKIPANEYNPDAKSRGVKHYDRDGGRGRNRERSRDNYNENDEKPREKIDIKKITNKEKDEIKDEVSEIEGSKNALIFNEDLKVMKKLPVSKLGYTKLDTDAYVIAIDGTATPRIINNCEKLRCHNLIASNFVNSDTDINLESI